MTTYVLMVFMFTGPIISDYSNAVASAYFNSKEACEIAKKEIESLGSMKNNIKAKCFKK